MRVDSGSPAALPGAGDLRVTMRDVILALLPCLLVGTWNVGRQVAHSLQRLDLDAAPGRRGALLAALGVDPDPGAWLACFLIGAAWVLPLLLVVAAATLAWEHLFARLRERRPGEGAIVTALIFTLLLPPAAPLTQAALGASFGIVCGKLLFGGTGRNFLNPAVSGLAFLWVGFSDDLLAHPLFPEVAGYRGSSAFDRAAEGGLLRLWEAGFNGPDAFIGVEPGRIGETSVIACLLGGAWLIARGHASWRIPLAVVLGIAGASFVALLGGPAGGLDLPWHLVLGGTAFAAFFVATDPVSSAATNGGRWLYGLTIGALIVLLRVAGPGHPDGVVPAILFGTIAAPLLDHVVVRRGVARRLRMLRGLGHV